MVPPQGYARVVIYSRRAEERRQLRRSNEDRKEADAAVIRRNADFHFTEAAEKYLREREERERLGIRTHRRPCPPHAVPHGHYTPAQDLSSAITSVRLNGQVGGLRVL
jgi:hypothetical protein